MAVHRIGLIALGLTLAAASATPALAAQGSPRVAHATMRYYTVGGTTDAQIRARLDARAPASPDGFRGDAFTRWNFRWNWPGYGSATCDLARATVTLSIVVSFPRWTHPAGAAPAVAADWARYTRALVRHEQGHVDYARARAPLVLRAIRRATCATADAAARAQLSLVRAHDVSYDARTRHGTTQGAHFP